MYEPGQILRERYELQRQLGNTVASRQTWLANDRTLATDATVVLKLLAFGPQVDWQEIELFEREAKTLQALHHPAIPRYRDYFAIDRDAMNPLPWFVLVQDHIAGHSLKELLSQGKHFSDRQVRGIAANLLHVLTYLHELSPPVLHRDIKPSNVVWGEDAYIYLVDFGSVQDRAATEGATFTVVGTYGYTPIEQFGGRAVPASDLYALGATLIHLLTGIAPADLPQKDLRIQFADRVSLDPAFVQWIARLAEPDVTKRFQSARQALEALQAAKTTPSQPTTTRRTAAETAPVAAPDRTAQLQRPTQTAGLERSPRPPYFSSIEVQQTADCLLIQIPNNTLWSLLLVIPLAIALVISLAIALAFVVPNFLASFFFVNVGQVWLFSLPIVLLIAGTAYWEMLPTYVKFERTQFSVYKRPFGSSLIIFDGTTWDIQDIFHTLKTFRSNKSTYERRVVVIQTDRREDYFAKGLSWEECSWLVDIICAWLQIKR